MKILITSEYESKNTYVKDIVDELRSYSKIDTEVINFWDSDIFYDIIHIQWPEELFKWKSVTENDIKNLQNRLQILRKKGSKIILTLHNKIPHRSQTSSDQNLYNFLYSEADAIVNLGKHSCNFYPNKKNVVIYHPNYEKHIKIKKSKISKENIFFSFGNIRHIEEEQQIIKGFLKSKIPNSKLIISNSMIGRNPYFKEGKLSLRKWLYIFYLRRLQKKNILFLNKKLNNEEINNYFNSADVVISPRIDNLNSGVVFMAFSFGKTVIGPNIGNIGEILQQTNNPTYKPQNIESIANAMKMAIDNKRIGEKNLKFSKTYLDPKIIAKQHYNLYLEILK